MYFYIVTNPFILSALKPTRYKDDCSGTIRGSSLAHRLYLKLFRKIKPSALFVPCVADAGLLFFILFYLEYKCVSMTCLNWMLV